MSRDRTLRTGLLDRIGWLLLALIAVVVVVALAVGDPRGSPGRDKVRSGPAPVEFPKAPPGAPEVGMYVVSTITPTGDIEVAHWINAAAPITVLELTAADPDELPGGVVARRVVVRGDSEVLSRRREVGTKRQVLRLARPAESLYVTYRLTGVVDDAGSVPGRLLVRSVALDVDYPGETGPTGRRISGPGTVTNVACMSREDLDRSPRPCGRAEGSGWLVEARGSSRDDRLLVQFELAP